MSQVRILSFRPKIAVLTAAEAAELILRLILFTALKQFSEKRGAKVVAEKKYIIDNAELMAEWDWGKNNELGFNPEILTLGSHKKTWWKCTNRHEWIATIKDRNNGRGCPYCAGKKVLKGENDLQSINPPLAKEWNYEKNNGLTPTDVTPGSTTQVDGTSFNHRRIVYIRFFFRMFNRRSDSF